MQGQFEPLGVARRIRVRMPLSGCRRYAWDCRPFGLGRIVAPAVPGVIELAPGVHLDLATGQLEAEVSSRRRSV